MVVLTDGFLCLLNTFKSSWVVVCVYLYLAVIRFKKLLLLLISKKWAVSYVLLLPDPFWTLFLFCFLLVFCFFISHFNLLFEINK